MPTRQDHRSGNQLELDRPGARLDPDIAPSEHAQPPQRVGRRNRYTVRASLPISLPTQRDIDLDSLLNVLLPDGSSDGRRQAMPSSDRHGQAMSKPATAD